MNLKMIIIAIAILIVLLGVIGFIMYVLLKYLSPGVENLENKKIKII